MSAAKLAPVQVVGLGGFEPPTLRLSGVRSNQLSYRPKRPRSAVRTLDEITKREQRRIYEQSER